MSDDRAVRALEDVVAVERLAPGLVRVVTWADAYEVDARGEGCRCPDKEYNEVPRCKHELAALLATSDRYPTPYVDATDAGTPTVLADGGVSQDEWRVVDHDNDDNVKPADSKSDAESKAETAREFGSDNVSVVPPGEPLPGETQEIPEDPCAICGDPVSIANARSGPGGQPIHGRCRGKDDDGDDEPEQHVATEPTEAQVVEEPDPEPATTSADAAQPDLPERDVGTDPLEWLPPEFVDDIQGSQCVNRKGFEVLAHFYDVDVEADLEVAPEDTGHEYCRVKATATTADGRVCEAYGSAHVDRDDDATLLLELAGTRARKRALSIATGTGAVAVAELRSQTKAELEASD